MSKKLVKLLKVTALLVAASLITTLASYAVVTNRNIRDDSMWPYITLTGRLIVNLPCPGGPHSADYPIDWMSNDPVLPETRGLPFNYHFWNPCHGHQILRTPFLLDLAFWFLLYACLYMLYRSYASHMDPTRKSHPGQPKSGSK